MTTIKEAIEGLKVFAKYGEGDICAKHDIILAVAGSYLNEVELTQEDKDKLEELGWHWNKEFKSWALII